MSVEFEDLLVTRFSRFLRITELLKFCFAL